MPNTASQGDFTIMTAKSLFFLPKCFLSGNDISSKGQVTTAFGRGSLAAILAAAMAVAPSLAPAQEKVNAKPVSGAKATQQDRKPILIDQVGDYSEEHPVIAIGI